MAYSSTTNLSLRKTVDEHNLVEDISNLEADVGANTDLVEQYLAGGTVINTNPSIVDTGGNRIVSLYACSAGSISTITGAKTNHPFTMVMLSSGASLSLLTANTKYLLSANWVPSTNYSSITLVWDGTRYIELARVTTA